MINRRRYCGEGGARFRALHGLLPAGKQGRERYRGRQTKGDKEAERLRVETEEEKDKAKKRRGVAYRMCIEQGALLGEREGGREEER